MQQIKRLEKSTIPDCSPLIFRIKNEKQVRIAEASRLIGERKPSFSHQKPRL